MSSPWLEARRGGITGTDAAAILGLTSFRTPLEVWAEKTGRIVPDDLGGIERIQWGNLLEPVVIAETNRRTGRELLELERWSDAMPHGRLEAFEHHGEKKAMIFSARFPWLRVTPDFVQASWRPLPWLAEQRKLDGPGIGEAKALGSHARKEWRTGATLQYNLQVATNILAAGLAWGTFGALIGGQTLRIFDYAPKPQVLEGLAIRLERFWLEHIVADVQPAASASERDTRVLEKLYPERKHEAALNLEGKQWDIFARDIVRIDQERSALRKQERELAARQARVENQLRQAIGSAPTAQTEGGVVFDFPTVRADAYTVKAKTYRKLRRR